MKRSDVVVTLRALADALSLVKGSSNAECRVVELQPDQWYAFIQESYDNDYDDEDEDREEETEWTGVAGPADSADSAFNRLLKKHSNPGGFDEVPYSSLTESQFKFWVGLAKDLDRKVSLPEEWKQKAKAPEPKAPVRKASAGLTKVLKWAESRFYPYKDQTTESYMDSVQKQLSTASKNALDAVKDLMVSKKVSFADVEASIPPGTKITLANVFGRTQPDPSWRVREFVVANTKNGALNFEGTASPIHLKDTILSKGKLGIYAVPKEGPPESRIAFWQITVPGNLKASTVDTSPNVEMSPATQKKVVDALDLIATISRYEVRPKSKEQLLDMEQDLLLLSGDRVKSYPIHRIKKQAEQVLKELPSILRKLADWPSEKDIKEYVKWKSGVQKN